MGFLKWAAIFAIVSIIAAIFGFSGIAEGAADVAKVLFYIFLGVVALLIIAGIVTWNKVT